MKIIVAVFIFAFLGIALCDSFTKPIEEPLFEAFKNKFNKSYKSIDEEQMRFQVFRENLFHVENLNKNAKNRNFGITQFMDLTPLEFNHLYLMPKRPLPAVSPLHESPVLNLTDKIPAEWDWRKDGLRGGRSCITPVKNQGQCGSCWAFSATEEIESMEFLQGHSKDASPRLLSVQQIVDCDKKAYGCNGGWTTAAYEYIIGAGGQDSQSSYPYTARDGGCRFDKKDINAKLQEWKYVTTTKNEGQMKDFTATTGPISICVDASSWQFYSGGVLTSCGSSIDHCVQLVGYGKYGDKEAWIVRNSWGTSWGLDGYILLEYGKNLCALADIPTYVVTSPW